MGIVGHTCTPILQIGGPCMLVIRSHWTGVLSFLESGDHESMLSNIAEAQLEVQFSCAASGSARSWVWLLLA